MIRSRLIRSLPAILAAFVVASCSDSGLSNPTAPVDATSGRSSDAALKTPALAGSSTDQSNLELRALWWKDRHKSVPSVSQWIGPSGGTISIPETGFTMTFPAGAVKAPINITVTPDQDYVSYKMEPAGTQFSKEVTVTQSLAATELNGEALRNQLFAAYIADNVKLSGNVPVLYLLPSHTIFSGLIPQAHVWTITHFSRYMLASG
jgi:hypothetical protein